MNSALREYMRKYFSDFRYLSSDAEPEILREFVRYEEVIDFVEQFGKDQQLSGFMMHIYECQLRKSVSRKQRNMQMEILPLIQLFLRV